MTEEIVVKKLSVVVPMSPEAAEEAQAFGAAVMAALTAPPGPPEKPWEGEPLTPPPADYARLLDLATDRIVRAVLVYHGPKPSLVRGDGTVSHWQCEGCDASGWEWDYPDWPCSTTDLIDALLDGDS